MALSINGLHQLAVFTKSSSLMVLCFEDEGDIVTITRIPVQALCAHLWVEV